MAVQIFFSPALGVQFCLSQWPQISSLWCFPRGRKKIKKLFLYAAVAIPNPAMNRQGEALPGYRIVFRGMFFTVLFVRVTGIEPVSGWTCPSMCYKSQFRVLKGHSKGTQSRNLCLNFQKTGKQYLILMTKHTPKDWWLLIIGSWKIFFQCYFNKCRP